MPKRKNSDNSDKIERYLRKIRKLEEKQRKTRRIRVISSSQSEKGSDDENSNQDEGEGENETPANSTPTEEGEKSIEEPQLDPEILLALGESQKEIPKYGPKIHESLAQLWTPILRKGLSQETRDKLTKDYVVPENCAFLKAPQLNPEILANAADSTRARDKAIESVQQKIGIGITALNKGLELLLDDGQRRLEAIKFLSDSCRILCDLHFTETESRQKYATSGIDKSFLHMIKDVERDEMLFSSKLPEKIKASKMIEKQGLLIKKAPPKSKGSNAATSQSSTSRIRSSGNYSSPHYSSNKGGRGGAKRNYQTGRGRGRTSTNTSTTQYRTSNQSKQHAATKQE